MRLLRRRPRRQTIGAGRPGRRGPAARRRRRRPASARSRSDRYAAVLSGLHRDGQSHLYRGAPAWSGSDREGRGGAVLTLQASFDVLEADAGAATLPEPFGRRSGAGVFDRDGELTLMVSHALSSGTNHDVATGLLVGDPVLDCVFDERLEHERREADAPE